MSEEQNKDEQLPDTGSRLPETGNREPETIEQPQTDNMEVHHHGHVHHQKKWKEYMFQFLMLFLAVFCGYLAEYQLEHTVEKDREKQYIQTMSEDLGFDTSALNTSIEELSKQILGKDSMILLLNKEKWTDEEVVQLYDFHWNYIGYGFPALFSKRTTAQLFNAGGLRLIRNQKVSDSITAYVANVDMIEDLKQAASVLYSQKALDISASIFDNKFIRFLPYEPYSRDTAGHPYLLTTNRMEIKKFAFMLEQDKDGFIELIATLHRQKYYAIKLIQLIKKEYHLK